MPDVLSLPTVEALRHCVHTLLCDRDKLDPTQTPLRTSVITRRGKPCGLFFQVDGPRLLKNYAVWAGDENRILFYDGAGERYNEVLLSEAPSCVV